MEQKKEISECNSLRRIFLKNPYSEKTNLLNCIVIRNSHKIRKIVYSRAND